MSPPRPSGIDALPMAGGLALRGTLAAAVAVAMAGLYVWQVAGLRGAALGAFGRELGLGFAALALLLGLPLHLGLTRALRAFAATGAPALVPIAWAELRRYSKILPVVSAALGAMLTGAILARRPGAPGDLRMVIATGGVLAVVNHLFFAQLACEIGGLKLQSWLAAQDSEVPPAELAWIPTSGLSRRLGLLLGLCGVSWAVLTATLVLASTRRLSGGDPAVAARALGVQLGIAGALFLALVVWGTAVVIRQVARSMGSLRDALLALGRDPGARTAPLIAGPEIARLAAQVRRAVAGFNQLEGVRAAFAQAGRYRVDALAGSGGFANVYRAYDLSIDRPVALKVVHPHLAHYRLDRARCLARLTREARAHGRVNHPNVVTIYDVGALGDVPLYLAREWVEGCTLAERLGAGRIAPAETIELARAIGGALDHVHRRGVVHRDLKPANILVGEAGPKLTDFDVAVVGEEAAPGEPIGTPGYMSPEALCGAGVDFRADQYALGVVLFEMLTGRAGFESRRQIALRTSARGALPRVSRLGLGLGPEVDAVLGRMTAHDPSARYGTLAAAVQDLEEALG